MIARICEISMAMKDLTSVPTCRDALRDETEKRYIAMLFVAFLPDTCASSEDLSKFKLAISASIFAFWEELFAVVIEL